MEVLQQVLKDFSKVLLPPPQTPLQHLPADLVPDGPPGLVYEIVFDCHRGLFRIKKRLYLCETELPAVVGHKNSAISG